MTKRPSALEKEKVGVSTRVLPRPTKYENHVRRSSMAVPQIACEKLSSLRVKEVPTFGLGISMHSGSVLSMPQQLNFCVAG